jgi:hypothetical protein
MVARTDEAQLDPAPIRGDRHRGGDRCACLQVLGHQFALECECAVGRVVDDSVPHSSHQC